MYRTTVALLLLAGLSTGSPAQEPPGVFHQPLVAANYLRYLREAQDLMRQKSYELAEKRCREAVRIAPQYPGAHFNLARCLALQKKNDDALASLTTAVEAGFVEADFLKKETAFETLRDDERFVKVVDAARKAKPLHLWPAKATAAAPRSGRVQVSEANTQWDVRNGIFLVRLAPGPKPGREAEVVKGMGEAGELVRKWYKEGTAAGHHGDFYDNHDTDHSVMSVGSFPQLTRIDFARAAKDVKGLSLHHGFQGHFFYTGVVLGNSSTAITKAAIWRSQTRYGYTNPKLTQALANQYANNHVYFYPEHRDHDPGHNGKGPDKEGGYGDVFPANTPYAVTSQGSSGSDRAFMDAFACALAAFRPEVKEKLVKAHAVAPTLQMIFRASNKPVKKAEDYLTGVAHPSVFDGGNLDVVRMVKMAHDLKADDLPPLVSLKVVEEDRPVLGRDYFDSEPRGERLFATPSAVARVVRSVQLDRRIVVSAEDSKDLNKKPLTYHWVVLRGDPKGVTIKPLNKEGTKAEIVVQWQGRRPVSEGSKLESNRVDVGVFVHNGSHYSAPAFVTFYAPDNQKRTYDEKGRVLSVDYDDATVGKNYVDPFVEVKKDWKDEYEYDKSGNLSGWTRTRGDKKESFTADGALVLEKDEMGRAVKARTVRYRAQGAKRNTVPVLSQQPGDEVLHYEYAGDEDRVGKIGKREKAD